MTSETLSAMAGVLLSLAAAYLPGFAGWFAGLGPVQKRLLMVALLALAAGGSLAVECAGWGAALGAPPAAAQAGCNTAGALGVARVFVMALVANQAAFQIAVQRTPRRDEFDYLAKVERFIPAAPQPKNKTRKQE